MVREENECCECETGLYPCRGNSCPNRHVKHYYCDKCKDEVEQGKLYKWDSEEWCINCIEKDLDAVE